MLLLKSQLNRGAQSHTIHGSKPRDMVAIDWIFQTYFLSQKEMCASFWKLTCQSVQTVALHIICWTARQLSALPVMVRLYEETHDAHIVSRFTHHPLWGVNIRCIRNNIVQFVMVRTARKPSTRCLPPITRAPRWFSTNSFVIRATFSWPWNMRSNCLCQCFLKHWWKCWVSWLAVEYESISSWARAVALAEGLCKPNAASCSFLSKITLLYPTTSMYQREEPVVGQNFAGLESSCHGRYGFLIQQDIGR